MAMYNTIECRDEGTDNRHIHENILSKCMLTVGTQPAHRKGSFSILSLEPPPLAHELAQNTVKSCEKHRPHATPPTCVKYVVTMSPSMAGADPGFLELGGATSEKGHTRRGHSPR
jgi:hypothetical protein